jgi:hypothetical protein
MPLLLLLLLLLQVCLTLTPAALGAYALPLFLRIHDGKQLQLQLHGTIVDPLHQVGLTPPGGHVLQLEAMPLGELDPPLQGYTLVNPGQVPLRYRWGPGSDKGQGVAGWAVGGSGEAAGACAPPSQAAGAPAACADDYGDYSHGW